MTVVEERPLSARQRPATGVDILDPAVYERGVPHAAFERLRHERPVSYHPEPDGPGFWAVVKHRDVVQVLRDAATFSSQAEGTQIPNLPRGDLRVSPDNPAVMDPPRHTQFRAIVGQAFTPSSTSRLEPYVRQRAASILGELTARGEFDFMADFAAKIPMAIILRMVGVPSEDEDRLDRWIVRLLATDDPEYQTSEDDRAATTEEFMEYAHTLAARRRRAPEDDLLSALMAAEVDGAKLSFEEFGMFFMLLLAAGTHTSRLSIGNGFRLLLDNPDVRARLLDKPSEWPACVDEILRLHPPLMHFRRTATRDTVLSGQRIQQGDKVVVWHPSANRDEEVFRDPHAFDAARKPNDHVSFGYGPHFCLGSALARLSIQTCLEECSKRMPSVQLREEPERLRSNWFNGFKRMRLVL